MYKVSSMKLNKLLLTSAVALGGLLMAQASMAEAQSATEKSESGTQDLEKVVIQGQQDTGFVVTQMKTATKLDLSLRQTPQSVSAISSELLKDFQLTSLNDALALTPGIQVERPETDRIYYMSRGFEITNFQMDGVGMPLSNNNVVGDMDTAMFERVEIIRGANGLTAGAGNPSATINMIRKRPTDEAQGNVGFTVGSWNKARLDADVSGALTDKVRGRVVVAKENKESYLDRYEQDKTLGYGVIEADLAPGVVLTLGHSTQRNDADSPLWGALPLVYSNGTPTNYDRSTSTSADWSYMDTTENRSFAELKKSFSNGWDVVASANYVELETDSELFYLFGTPNQADESGVVAAYASEYDLDERQQMLEVYASGPFNAFGRSHELVVGANHAQARVTQLSLYDDTTVAGFSDPSALTQINVAEFNGDYPRPNFTNAGGGGVFEETQTSVFATSKLQLSDNNLLILGGRASQWESEGNAYGSNKKTNETVFVPYLGFVHDLTSEVSAYASYTETFLNQTELNADLERLDPKTGINYEVGLKADVNTLNASFAVFQTKQDDVATPTGVKVNGFDTYTAEDGISSEGFELELAGKLTENLNLSTGFTQVKIEDAEGESTNLYIPEKTFNLALSYNLGQLTLGSSLDWQSEIEGTVKQDAYLLSSFMAGYEFSDRLNANLVVNNLGDEKYINSLKWGQGYYGAPRNITAYVNYSF
jgi:outer membrane receptor for ferric coprogen and ferric-rhodotorulic acid